MSEGQSTELEAALDRLTRFAQGERMQNIWSGDYVPDLIRADLVLILADEDEA